MQNHEIWHEPGPGVSVQAGGGGGGIGLLNPPGRPATEKHRKHVQNLHFSRFSGPKRVKQKVEIEGVGPIWRAPG